MAKRAYSSAFTLLMVISIFILIIPTFYFLLSLADNYTELISTYNLEDYTIVHRIYYSKNSIFYTDKITERTYPNIVDLERFSEKVIMDLLGNKIREDVGVSIILEYNNNKKEIYVNKESYLFALSRYDIYDIVSFKRIVQVQDNGQIYTGSLALDVSFKEDGK